MPLLLPLLLTFAATIGRMDRNTFDGGFCPSVALLNHACRPNCVAALSAVDEAAGAITLEIRTLEPVLAGAELTISYLDGTATYLPADVRQRSLAHWGFQCGCPRCACMAGPAQPGQPGAALTELGQVAAEKRLLAVRCQCGAEQLCPRPTDVLAEFQGPCTACGAPPPEGWMARAEATVAATVGALERPVEDELGHLEADRLSDHYGECAAVLGGRHWLLNRLNDRLAKAYRRAAIEFRCASSSSGSSSSSSVAAAASASVSALPGLRLAA